MLLCSRFRQSVKFCIRIYIESFLHSVLLLWVIQSTPIFMIDGLRSSSISWTVRYFGGISSSPCFLLDWVRSSSASWDSIRCSPFLYLLTALLLAALSGVLKMMSGDPLSFFLRICFRHLSLMALYIADAHRLACSRHFLNQFGSAELEQGAQNNCLFLFLAALASGATLWSVLSEWYRFWNPIWQHWRELMCW